MRVLRMRSLRTLYALSCVTALVLAAVPARAQTVDPNAGIEVKVRAAFPDAPDMVLVAKCESSFMQFSAPDVVLRGGSGKGYLGIFQIGEKLHAGTALALGLDIRTIDGNIGYARHLYDERGIAPWRECAPKTAAAPVPPSAVPVAVSGSVPSVPVVSGAPAATVLTGNFVLGSRDAQIRTVQKLLNAAGFTIAASGPGSPGNETDYFGALTRDALRKFQCAKGIACDGSESTTGYGRVGPKTRAALLALPAAN